MLLQLLIACCTFQLPIASWKMWHTFGMGRDIIIQPMPLLFKNTDEKERKENRRSTYPPMEMLRDRRQRIMALHHAEADDDDSEGPSYTYLQIDRDSYRGLD